MADNGKATTVEHLDVDGATGEVVDGIDVGGVMTPAIVVLRMADGSVAYVLKGVGPLEAPTVLEVGLGRLRVDLGLARLA